MLTYQVLAHCAHAECYEAHTHQLAQQLSEFTQWEGVSAQAEAHGLGPLLYVHLRAAGTLLPPTVKRELQGLYLRHRQANRVRARVLGEILAAYNAAGIQALVLKGAALSHLIYPEPGLRPMGDLDLLVRKAEARRAQSLLTGLGFSAPLPGGETLPDKSMAQAILLTEGLPVGVEIHHNLCEGFDPLSMTVDDLTAAPLPFSLGSTTAYTLGYEDMLWHLCHHMIIHSIGNPIRLIWVADIVSFAERFLEQIDWGRIRRHYPMILNTLSLLHFVTPLSEALLGKAPIETGRQPQGIAVDLEARPQIRLAHWRRKGYWRVWRRALFPSELWLRMYYVLDTTRWLFWYRWVRHPLEMLRLFGPRLLTRIRRRISERLVTPLFRKLFCMCETMRDIFHIVTARCGDLRSKLVGHCVGNNRFAYVFYATDDEYAVAVLVVAKLLRQFSIRDDVDFVVLHLPLADYILTTMHEMGIITKRVEQLRYDVYNPYFRHCLIKLRILQLTGYDRIVFLDADTIPLKSLDHLFTLSFSEVIAAPRAYWLPQPFVTSLLLVVKPSLVMWNRVKRHFKTAFEKKYYDMDIINLEFGEEIFYLPDEYACLNSGWEDTEKPFHFGKPEKSYERIQVVHFTALGKPWWYHPDKVRRLRPNAHPIFYELWEKWWLVREQIIEARSPISRLRFSFLKHASQREN